jgi:hypothetical protein
MAFARSLEARSYYYYYYYYYYYNNNMTSSSHVTEHIWSVSVLVHSTSQICVHNCSSYLLSLHNLNVVSLHFPSSLPVLYCTVPQRDWGLLRSLRPRVAFSIIWQWRSQTWVVYRNCPHALISYKPNEPTLHVTRSQSQWVVGTQA